MTDLDERPAGSGDPGGFPRTDLPALRHQQVRSFLVREAGQGPRRGARVRRLAPAVAAVAVLGVAGATLVPGTPLGRRIGAVVAAVTGQDDVVCGGVRAPRADDDTAAVRYLPAGATPASVSLSMTSTCVGHTDPSVPTPLMDAWDTDPVWTVVETDGSTVQAAYTVWRSLPPGISADVADGRSVAVAADRRVPDAVPESERLPVRGGTGTLVRPGVGSLGAATVLTWTEPDGRRWSVTGKGVTDGDLRAFVDALVVRGGTASLGGTGPVPGALTPEVLATALVASPYWMRLDVPAGARHTRPDRLTAIDTPRLTATFTGPDYAITLDADAAAVPWQSGVGVGDRLTMVNGSVPALLGAAVDGRTFGGLTWSLPDGVTATLSTAPAGVDEPTLAEFAGSVAAVPAHDPRLARSVAVEQPGVRPDGSTPSP